MTQTMWSTCWGTTFESMKYLLCLSSFWAMGIYVMSFSSTFIYFVWDSCYLKQKLKHCKWKFIEDIKGNFKFENLYILYKNTVTIHRRFWWCLMMFSWIIDHLIQSRYVKVPQYTSVNFPLIITCVLYYPHKLLI